MSRITVNFDRITGPIKPMHAVNNGPSKARSDQSRGNMDAWIEAGIPYARNHDAAFTADYGGEHTVDVGNIFPDFDADVNDPASYDFLLTDLYCQTIQDGGTKVFYRLGNKIEHWAKKYGTLPPKDFRNGPKSVSISSCITQKAGLTVTTGISNIGRFGMNRIWIQMKAQTNAPGAALRLNFSNCTVLPLFI